MPSLLLILRNAMSAGGAGPMGFVNLATSTSRPTYGEKDKKGGAMRPRIISLQMRTRQPRTEPERPEKKKGRKKGVP